MFFKLFALFAMVAVAFASPKPEPQFVSYPSAAVAPVAYSAYSPVGYSAPYAAAAAYPYAYSGAYYVR